MYLYPFGHPRGTWVFSNFKGFIIIFLKNLNEIQRFTNMSIFLIPLSITLYNSKILGILLLRK